MSKEEVFGSLRRALLAELRYRFLIRPTKLHAQCQTNTKQQTRSTHCFDQIRLQQLPQPGGVHFRLRIDERALDHEEITYKG